jgi:hypothetical protein
VATTTKLSVGSEKVLRVPYASQQINPESG